MCRLCSLTQSWHNHVKYKSSLSQQSSGMQPIQHTLTQMPWLKRFGLTHGHQHFSRPQQQLSLINQCYFIDHLAGPQQSPAFYSITTQISVDVSQISEPRFQYFDTFCELLWHSQLITDTIIYVPATAGSFSSSQAEHLKWHAVLF